MSNAREVGGLDLLLVGLLLLLGIATLPKATEKVAADARRKIPSPTKDVPATPPIPGPGFRHNGGPALDEAKAA